MRRRPFTLALTGVLALGACASPYQYSRVDVSVGDDPSFPGLLTYVSRQNDPERVAKIFYIHGMCTHPPEWGAERGRKLQEVLGIANPIAVAPEVSLPGNVGVRRLELRSPAIGADIDFVRWSPLTDDLKQSLSTPESYPPTCGAGGPSNAKLCLKRARLNADLQVGLMNDCLSDAVIYSGPNGDRIRQGVEEAVCRFMGGTIARGGACRVSDGEASGPVVFIAESLGSKILFDAIVSLTQKAKPRERPSFEALVVLPQDELIEKFNDTTAVYMLANQIPILDLAGSLEVRDAGVSLVPSIEAFANIITAEEREGVPIAPEKVYLVNFTDPNDLLSYRLSPALADRIDNIRVVNVFTSNTPAIAGFVAHPLVAHRGFDQNEDVLHLLAQGYLPKRDGTERLLH